MNKEASSQALINHGATPRHAAALTAAMAKWGITTRQQQIHFLAQIAAESSFVPQAENMNYSARRITQVWPNRFPDVTSATPFAHNPEALANNVYANRMGNGPPETGDGYRYRGRGFMQNTGKAQYEKLAAELGIPLVEDPDLLLEPEHAADAAAWYWMNRNLNKLADAGDTKGITLAINGGLNGLDSRLRWVEKLTHTLPNPDHALLIVYNERNEVVGTFPIPAGADLIIRHSESMKRVHIRPEIIPPRAR